MHNSSVSATPHRMLVGECCYQLNWHMGYKRRNSTKTVVVLELGLDIKELPTRFTLLLEAIVRVDLLLKHPTRFPVVVEQVIHAQT